VPLALSPLLSLGVGVAHPFPPVDELGFTALPAAFLVCTAGLAMLYLVLIEFGKKRFYALHGGLHHAPKPRRCAVGSPASPPSRAVGPLVAVNLSKCPGDGELPFRILGQVC
jgi:hypothetical protein